LRQSKTGLRQWQKELLQRNESSSPLDLDQKLHHCPAFPSKIVIPNNLAPTNLILIAAKRPSASIHSGQFKGT